MEYLTPILEASGITKAFAGVLRFTTNCVGSVGLYERAQEAADIRIVVYKQNPRHGRAD